jgi:CheY-like chemotaxis protein
MIAKIGAAHLQRLGYSVTATSSSDEALATFRSQPDNFDVVITDQTMPGRTGIQLTVEIKSIRADVPVVLMTGFSEAVTPERLSQVGIGALLMKPFVSATLAKAVRDALDGTGGRDAER